MTGLRISVAARFRAHLNLKIFALLSLDVRLFKQYINAFERFRANTYSVLDLLENKP